MAWDKALFLWINGLAGRVPLADRFFQGVSNDYFPVIVMCLAMACLWFGTRDDTRRAANQGGVIAAMLSLVLASGLVALSNLLYNRPRPFDELPAAVLFYQPTDPSFPSNLAAVLFGAALAILVRDRRAGWWLLALAALSGFGRVYLGVHYPTDILGGALFGAAGTMLAYGLIRLFKRQLDWLLAWLRRLSLAG
jgi:undecaprenyl-diphosphatase